MNLNGTIRINKCGVAIIVIIIFLLFLYTYKGKDEEASKDLNSSFRKSNVAYDSNRDVVSLTKLLIASVDVAENGGKEVVAVREGKDNFLGEQSKGKTKEGANDVVTDGDFRSHQVMYYGMKSAFPKIKVISEEHIESGEITKTYVLPILKNSEISSVLVEDELIPSEDVAVWIDPLDATQEYTENLLEYVTTMVCVAIRGIPTIGVIHRPFTKETFWGVVGHGNSIKLNELRNTHKKNVLDKFHLIVSRSHSGKVKNYTQAVLGEDDHSYDITYAGGAGYKVLEVISGDADAYLHVTHIKKWDVCAGNAVLASIGGVMTTIQGDKLDYSAQANPVNSAGILAYIPSSSHIINKLSQIVLEA